MLDMEKRMDGELKKPKPKNDGDPDDMEETVPFPVRKSLNTSKGAFKSRIGSTGINSNPSGFDKGTVFNTRKD